MAYLLQLPMEQFFFVLNDDLLYVKYSVWIRYDADFRKINVPKLPSSILSLHNTVNLAFQIHVFCNYNTILGVLVHRGAMMALIVFQ